MPDQWQLVDFYERLTDWVAEQQPPQRLVDRVVEWVPTLELDPYHGAHPEPGANGRRWLVEVTDATTRGLTVVCSIQIDPDASVVRLNRIELRDDPPRAGH